jgi:hypothetical protein
MVQRIIRNNYKNFGLMGLGGFLFFLSFHVGEASLLGGIMHLSGCAFFCTGVHGIHDVKMEEEVHPHPHH